ncbi:MAG TPA: hypothetical protein VKF36_19740 [Syntrophorhabdales bacterium]|nr:hypothetical protein [Syntrophorhabdales bacterium]
MRNVLESDRDDAGKISPLDRRSALAIPYLAGFLTLGMLLKHHCELSTTIGVMMFVNMILAMITLYLVREESSDAKVLDWLFFGGFNFLVIIGLIGSLCLKC